MTKPGDVSYDGRVFVRGIDHEFQSDEKVNYDRLSAAGRTYYDELRWFEGKSNNEAFELARAEYGFSRYFQLYGNK